MERVEGEKSKGTFSYCERQKKGRAKKTIRCSQGRAKRKQAYAKRKEVSNGMQ